MKIRLGAFCVIAFLCAAICSVSAANDPTVDELLKKLPPPEQVAKPIQTALAQIDPALVHPLLHQIIAAVQKRDMSRALTMTRQLGARHPKSAGAANLEGALAYRLHQYAPAYDAFKRAANIQPKSWFAYLGLGITAGAQDRYSLAAEHFRHTTKIAPRCMPAWLYLSDCAARTHQFAESAAAARQVTALAPNFYGGWWELARAERALGHAQAAIDAIKRERTLLAQHRQVYTSGVRVVH